MAKGADNTKDRFLECLEKAEQNQSELFKEWRKNYEVYLGKPDETRVGRRSRKADDDWRSRLYVKHAFQQIETLLPEFLVEDPNFEVIARERDDEGKAATVQKLLDYQLDRDRYSEKRMAAVKKAIIFGACPIKITWAYDQRRMRVRNPITDEERAEVMLDPTLSDEERETLLKPYIWADVTVRDDPSMIVVDPFDFFWDPAATTLDDASWVMHRSWLSDEQLLAKEKAGLYTGISELLKDSGGGESKSSGWGWDGVKRLLNERQEEAEAKRGDRHEVIEKWSRDKLVVMVDRKIIARDVPNPYWHGQLPFVMAITQPDIDSMTGLSEVWSIKSIQEAIWYIHNAQNDALALTLDPPIALDDRDPRLKEFLMRPGARLFTSNPTGAFKPIDIGQANAYASGAEGDRLRGLMELVTGINAAVSGTSNEGTATEAAMNLRQSKSRIALKVANVDSSFARAAEQFIQLDQQFVDDDRVFRIVGDSAEWGEATPDDIAGAFDVRPRNSSDRTVKELAREQSLNLLNALAQFIPYGLNFWPLVDKAAVAHDLTPGALRPEQGAMPAAPMLGGGQPPIMGPGGGVAPPQVGPDAPNVFAPPGLQG